MRTRQVHGDRRQSSAATVYCPRRQSSLPFTECMTCCECDRVATTAEGTAILCTDPSGRAAALATSDRLATTPVGQLLLSEVMTTDVVCVYPDLRVYELSRLLEERGIDGAPVVAEDGGRPIGVVSKTDLARRLPSTAIVADVMTSLAFVLPESATLSQASALMGYEGIHRLPVISTDGRVVGILSSLDIVRCVAASEGYLAPSSSRLLSRPPGDEP